MTIASQLDSMLLMVAGNTVIESLIILALFAYMCFKRKYGIIETLYVIFPVIIGMSIATATTTNYLPAWVGGILIMGIGAVWGLATTKIANSLEPYAKIYVIFLGMNLALTLSGYSLTTYVYSHNDANMDFTSQYPMNSTATGFIMQTTAVQGIAIPFIDFALGGGVVGFLLISGLPTEVVTLIGYPIAALALLAILPLLRLVIEIMRGILDITIGTIAKFIGR